MEFESPKQLEAAFRDMQQSFDGKETEQNWQQREKNVAKLKRITAGQAPQMLTNAYLIGVRLLLDGILKTVNSLRTTLSTAGCSLVQDIANASGPGIDNMVEILLQNFVKLCANTKPITRINGDETVLAILSNASYHLRLMQHVQVASQDKNTHPRRFACGWLRKIIKKHPRHVIEHAGGLDLIEKCLKASLQDRDKDVREAMRPTYWAFTRRWPERADSIISVLDKIKQEQLLADDSNPNKPKSSSTAPPAVEERSKFSKSTSSVPSGKPSLKEVKARMAAQKRAEALGERPSSAQAIASPKLDIHSPVKKKSTAALNDHRSAFSKSSNSVNQGKSSLKEFKAKILIQNTPQLQGDGVVAAEIFPTNAQELVALDDGFVEASSRTNRSESHQNSAPGQVKKPSLKDIKYKLGAQKPIQDGEQSPLVDMSKHHGASDSTHSPEKGPSAGLKKSRYNNQPFGALSPGLQGMSQDDLVTVPSIAKPPAYRRHQTAAERPRSADAPRPQFNRQPSATLTKVGNLTSAPMRPKRKPATKKYDPGADVEAMGPQSSENGVPEETPLRLGSPHESELLKDDGVLDNRRNDEVPTEYDLPSQQEMFKVYESYDALKNLNTVEKIESPLHCLKLLESAEIRIRARSLDIHGFRKLQNLIREQSSNATIWQDGYKVEELLLPLSEWIEEPLQTRTETDINHALDVRTQILLTTRLLLKHHRQYAKTLFVQILSSLLVARNHFTGKEHIVSGVEETITYIVAHCNPRECMSAICDMAEHDLGSRAYELALHTLSSLLHRLHKVPTDGGLGQKFTQTDENLARRLGRITSALLDDQDLVIRRAAIEVAVEFYYCVSEEDFFSLITRKNENHRNVLLYYLSRHQKDHDEVEM